MQLKMRWTNDNAESIKPTMPENCEIKCFSEAENALDDWLDTVQYGLSDGRKQKDYYEALMVNWENYNPDMCYLLYCGGECAATLTVIPNYETMEGYIHMVACNEKFRGRGYGTFLNAWAVWVLKKEKMKTAYLTTDDFRIPAIKSYLRAGFIPEYNAEDSPERWEKIMAQIKK